MSQPDNDPQRHAICGLYHDYHVMQQPTPHTVNSIEIYCCMSAVKQRARGFNPLLNSVTTSPRGVCLKKTLLCFNCNTLKFPCLLFVTHGYCCTELWETSQ